MFYRQYIKIVDVTLRDGLQNLNKFIPTKQKLTILNDLRNCNVKHVETTSFVKLKNMSDHNEVVQQLPNDNGIYSVLCLNKKGLNNLMKCDNIKHVAFGVSPSNTFCLNNMNKTRIEVIQNVKEMVKIAKQKDLHVRVYVSNAIHCVFEGYQCSQEVARLSKTFLEMGVDEISIGDTTGMSSPLNIKQLMNNMKHVGVSPDYLNGHFHNTYGMGLANVVSAIECGVTSFDASLCGLGGCNFSPGASGNIPMEDLIFMLHSMGYDTGIDFDKLMETSHNISNMLEIKNEAFLSKLI